MNNMNINRRLTAARAIVGRKKIRHGVHTRRGVQSWVCLDGFVLSRLFARRKCNCCHGQLSSERTRRVYNILNNYNIIHIWVPMRHIYYITIYYLLAVLYYFRISELRH